MRARKVKDFIVSEGVHSTLFNGILVFGFLCLSCLRVELIWAGR
jgi:hypothetical protein